MSLLRAALGLALAGALALGGLVAVAFVRSPVTEAAAWDPPPPLPFEGAWAPNHRLADVAVIPTGGPTGPEDVAVGADGTVYATMSDHTILRWRTPEAAPEVFLRTEGRPLGLDVAVDGRLLVADAVAGLVAYDTHGHREVLCNEANGRPVRFADDVEIGSDDVAYFSDVSSRFPHDVWKLDLIEGGNTGRLLAVDLTTGACTELLGGLHFANGVAVAPDASYVLVVETARYRVTRLWRTGPKAGSTDVFIDRLPGFPDGISRGANGRFWVSLASPRNTLLDLAGPHPWLRRVIAGLPAALQPAPEPFAMVVALDGEGRVVHMLQDPAGAKVTTISSVQEVEGRLWLGSLVGDTVAWLPAP